MKHCIEPHRWQESSRAWQWITKADEILSEFADRGYRLTVRQLYYQFVARQPCSEEFENNSKTWRRFKYVIGEARLSGNLDWDHIEDRLRGVRGNTHWKNLKEIAT